MFRFVVFFLLFLAISGQRKRPEDKTKCPNVRAIRNFDLEQVTLKLLEIPSLLDIDLIFIVFEFL